MNIKSLYVAVEFEDNRGNINDTGSIEDSPEKAWEAVEGIFHAPSTVICQLTQHASIEGVPVQREEYKVVPIGK